MAAPLTRVKDEVIADTKLLNPIFRLVAGLAVAAIFDFWKLRRAEITWRFTPTRNTKKNSCDTEPCINYERQSLKHSNYYCRVFSRRLKYDKTFSLSRLHARDFKLYGSVGHKSLFPILLVVVPSS